MSAIWFIILSLAWGKGIEIDNISFMMIAIFYVGDCILIRNRGDKAIKIVKGGGVDA